MKPTVFVNGLGYRGLGWKPSKPDFRDHKFKVVRHLSLPSTCDLRKTGFLPAVYDQGNLGSCTANAAAAAYAFAAAKAQKHPVPNPSRLFIYYNERVIEGTVGEDSGAELRDAAKTLNKQGVCEEALWPYLVSKFKSKPLTKCYQEGLVHHATTYESIDNTEPFALMSCLAINGLPIMFGCSVYDSFESEKVATTGKVTMPKKSEKMLGGHAMLIVGYNRSGFIVRNSWSAEWGKDGYCTMPAAYLTNPDLASDFWKIEAVS